MYDDEPWQKYPSPHNFWNWGDLTVQCIAEGSKNIFVEDVDEPAKCLYYSTNHTTITNLSISKCTFSISDGMYTLSDYNVPYDTRPVYYNAKSNYYLYPNRFPNKGWVVGKELGVLEVNTLNGKFYSNQSSTVKFAIWSNTFLEISTKLLDHKIQPWEHNGVKKTIAAKIHPNCPTLKVVGYKEDAIFRLAESNVYENVYVSGNFSKSVY